MIFELQYSSIIMQSNELSESFKKGAHKRWGPYISNNGQDMRWCH